MNHAPKRKRESDGMVKRKIVKINDTEVFITKRGLFKKTVIFSYKDTKTNKTMAHKI
jgi:hypothetical protein